MVYLNGRCGSSHYDPTIGRWTTKDPIGFDGGDTNLYAYVGGNPMSNVDPSGLKTEVKCRPLSGAAGSVGSHCYLVITPETGSTLGNKQIVMSLFNQNGMGFLPGATGHPTKNDPRDTTSNYSGQVSPNQCISADNFDKSIYAAFNSQQVSNYSNVPFSVNNSNTFVHRIIFQAGGLPPVNIPSEAYGF